MRRAIEQREAIAATHALVLNGLMTGVWMLQDYWEHVEDKGSIWSRKWNKNTPLAAEAAIFLTLLNAVESNMRAHEEGKIKTHMD